MQRSCMYLGKSLPLLLLPVFCSSILFKVPTAKFACSLPGVLSWLRALSLRHKPWECQVVHLVLSVEHQLIQFGLSILMLCPSLSK